MFLFNLLFTVCSDISDLLYWPQTNFSFISLSTDDLSSSSSEKIKAIIWTSQTKSINLSAAISSPCYPPIMIEVSLNRGCPGMLCTSFPSRDLLPLSLLFIFIHIHSHLFSSFLFPSLSSLLLFISYRLAQYVPT